MNFLGGGMSFAVLNDRYPLTFTYSIRGKVHGVVIIKIYVLAYSALYIAT